MPFGMQTCLDRWRCEFAEQTIENRMTEPVAMGAAASADCHPCMDHHRKKCDELGILRGEVAAAVEAGMMVNRGAESAIRLLPPNRHLGKLNAGTKAKWKISDNAGARPTMSRMRVLIYVQYLLGFGHLTRSCVIAKELAERGAEVVIASGGMPVPHLFEGGTARLHQLPPMRSADVQFDTFLDEYDNPVTDSWKARRRESLLSLFECFAPDVLVIESFPFGRRMVRFELLPLLEATQNRRPRPMVICSVRDIVQAKRKPGRVEETVDLLATYFDLVMVHGDPKIIRFDESFPLTDQIEGLLSYTGYVVPEIAAGTDEGRGEVIVSTGGGAFGAKLFDIAVAARRLSKLEGVPWRLLLGPNLARSTKMEIERLADSGVVVEPFRRDYRALLGNCDVSVSLGGYNTVTDVLATQTNAVVVSYSGIKETEQATRGRRLAELGLVAHINDYDLTPARLAQAVDVASAASRSTNVMPNLNGAANAAKLVLQTERASSAA